MAYSFTVRDFQQTLVWFVPDRLARSQSLYRPSYRAHAQVWRIVLL